ncbi:MAG TPA: PilZ domain-containing protein [Phycisphaerae bacterium]|nr:PilZ domain-containing protein [Phycisphaerae bacterium]
MQNPIPAVASPEAASAATLGGLTRRRAVPRSPHRVPCRLKVFDSPTGSEWAVCGETVNISPAGVAVQLGKPIPEGTAVEVLIPHLDADPLCVHGIVAHTRRVLTGTFEIGIRRQPHRDPHWP